MGSVASGAVERLVVYVGKQPLLIVQTDGSAMQATHPTKGLKLKVRNKKGTLKLRWFVRDSLVDIAHQGGNGEVTVGGDVSSGLHRHTKGIIFPGVYLKVPASTEVIVKRSGKVTRN